MSLVWIAITRVTFANQKYESILFRPRYFQAQFRAKRLPRAQADMKRIVTGVPTSGNHNLGTNFAHTVFSHDMFGGNSKHCVMERVQFVVLGAMPLANGLFLHPSHDARANGSRSCRGRCLQGSSKWTK